MFKQTSLTSHTALLIHFKIYLFAWHTEQADFGCIYFMCSIKLQLKKTDKANRITYYIGRNSLFYRN